MGNRIIEVEPYTPQGWGVWKDAQEKMDRPIVSFNIIDKEILEDIAKPLKDLRGINISARIGAKQALLPLG